MIPMVDHCVGHFDPTLALSHIVFDLTTKLARIKFSIGITVLVWSGQREVTRRKKNR